MEKFLKLFRAEVKEVNKEKHTLTAVISTKKVDRDGDIIEPEAMKKRLKVYRDHPVLLSSHNYYDLRKQIGRALSVDVADGEVVAKFEYFVGQGNEEADWAWVLAEKGIASFSIGFMGHEFDWIKEKDSESGNERITGRRFTDIELLEVSQVLIPSNRGALQSERSISQERIELCELAIKSFKEEEFTPPARKTLEDRTWQCECGNNYAFVEGAKEFVCKCGKQCSVKMNKTHYSEILLGKEAVDPAISAPEGEAKKEDVDFINAISQVASSSAKGAV